jgi:hypothetical protein
MSGVDFDEDGDVYVGSLDDQIGKDDGVYSKYYSASSFPTTPHLQPLLLGQR